LLLDKEKEREDATGGDQENKEHTIRKSVRLTFDVESSKSPVGKWFAEDRFDNTTTQRPTEDETPVRSLHSLSVDNTESGDRRSLWHL